MTYLLFFFFTTALQIAHMRRPLWLGFTQCELAAMRELSVPGLGIVLKDDDEDRNSEEVEGNLRGLRQLEQALTVVPTKAHKLISFINRSDTTSSSAARASRPTLFITLSGSSLCFTFSHALEAYKDNNNLTCLVPTV